VGWGGGGEGVGGGGGGVWLGPPVLPGLERNSKHCKEFAPIKRGPHDESCGSWTEKMISTKEGHSQNDGARRREMWRENVRSNFQNSAGEDSG